MEEKLFSNKGPFLSTLLQIMISRKEQNSLINGSNNQSISILLIEVLLTEFEFNNIGCKIDEEERVKDTNQY
ncbi:hypothetical protein RCL_jg13923.t1 [Rhizophagus clarus]|uniref:Uncharacterized protein n=1 Tax=Rhizophagus clarus TaxID=94130 RepID=A0A8H3LUT6_9GLOM|nr:hypothetical protein RCL_jg13923.t1 [Rhizophagus clarus]